MHTCVSKLCHHWVSKRVVACSSPGPYLNQFSGLILGLETSLQSNTVSLWLGASLESALNAGFWLTAHLEIDFSAWWRQQMETFSTLLAICAGNSPVPGEFPTQRPVTRSFDVYFDLRPNKRLCKQSWGWWFETLSWSLWRHCNGNVNQNTGAFIQKIGFESIICKMATILSQLRWWNFKKCAEE